MVDPAPSESDKTWDVAVVGAGMAGSLVADRLRRAGASVVVLESGPRRMHGASVHDRLAGRWPGGVRIRSEAGRTRKPVAAIVGHGPGGSAALYGAALERFRPMDFDGTRPAGSGSLPTAWPVGASEMVEWYDRVEKILGVAGGREDGTFNGRLPPICERDRALVDTLMANGRSPYRLPVAISYKPGCSECQGQPCERRCKGEGWNSVLANAEENDRFRICFNAHVGEVSTGVDGTIQLNIVTESREPARRVRARQLVLTAGALNTPRLLSASHAAFQSAPHELIGRGLMFHGSDLFSVATARGLKIDGPKKTLGLRDFYDLPLGRGGEIQSLGFDLSSRLVSRHLSEMLAAKGVPGGSALMTALRIPAAVVAQYLGQRPILATILEDLPYPENRVVVEPDRYLPKQPITIQYRIDKEFSDRWSEMRSEIRRAFAPLPVTFLLRRVTPNLGHPCGTVRMGDDPAFAPLDRSGRLRGTKVPIYVADASAFPSSGGTNPALTVAANALRIAEGICAQIRH